VLLRFCGVAARRAATGAPGVWGEPQCLRERMGDLAVIDVDVFDLDIV